MGIAWVGRGLDEDAFLVFDVFSDLDTYLGILEPDDL